VAVFHHCVCAVRSLTVVKKKLGGKVDEGKPLREHTTMGERKYTSGLPEISEVVKKTATVSINVHFNEVADR